MPEKFLLSPRRLIGNLWQEGSCTIALTHINALFAQLEFVDGMDALHRGKHGNLYVDVWKLGYIDCWKSWVFKGSSLRHLADRLIEWHILSEMSDATSQPAVLMQRYKSST